MNLKRRYHSKIVNSTREKKNEVTITDVGVAEDVVMATEEDLAGFDNPKNLANTKEKNKST